jgi:hypothetical protein
MTTPSSPRSLSSACLVALVAATCLLSGCVPMPTDATAQASANASNGAGARYLLPGAYFLRTVDGRPVPVAVGNGVTVTSAYVVADTTERSVIGWGEGVIKGSTSSARLGTGTARVLSQSPTGASIAVVSWGTSAAALDTVRWTPDSVIFARTVLYPSALGAGRRLVYTRVVAADTL